MTETVTEVDLLAYVDGQLLPARRAEVEHHLMRDPAAARRIAADLAVLEGLRLLFGRPVREPVALAGMAEDYTSFLA